MMPRRTHRTISICYDRAAPIQWSAGAWESTRQKAAERGECQFETDFSFV